MFGRADKRRLDKMTCHVNHKNMWDGIFDRDDDGPGFE